jgi:hypothetical protein
MEVSHKPTGTIYHTTLGQTTNKFSRFTSTPNTFTHGKIINTRTKKYSPKPSSFPPYQREFRIENRIGGVCNLFPFLERTEFRIFYPHSKTPFTL